MAGIDPVYPYVFMVVGLPCSGQERALEFLAKHPATSNAVVISYRAVLSKRAKKAKMELVDAYEGFSQAGIHRRMAAKINEAANNRKTIIIDGDNITKSDRDYLLSSVPGFYNKVAVTLPVPTRGDLSDRYGPCRFVSKDEMTTLLDLYESPGEDEFDSVVEFKLEDAV